MRALVVCLACVACGHGDPAPQPKVAPSEPALAKDAVVELPATPLGLADVGAFDWRHRAGHAAFRAARKAEHREDWPAVAAACKQALAADPQHLEAAWLAAVAAAKLGREGEILAPLVVAGAGDFGKWALASLEQPALQGWLATPIGQAWRRRVDADRAAIATQLGRALLVTAHGDVFAFDLVDARWLRLTRTYGGVIAALAAPGGHRLAYVTRMRNRMAIGVVDLATGHATKPVDVGAAPSAAAPIALAYSAAAPAGFWIGVGATWRQLDDDGALHPLPAKTARPAGDWLEIHARSARLHRVPQNASADWDQRQLASAMRLKQTGRVVTAGTGLVDGSTVVWSPDRAQLAFVAVDEPCVKDRLPVAALVADASTGTAREIAPRAQRGYALEWLPDGRLAIGGDTGVRISAPGSTASPVDLPGVALLAPRHLPSCTPEPAEEEPAGSGNGSGSAGDEETPE